MSLSELLVMLVGLIVGWAVVSRIISAHAPRPTNYVVGQWFEILDVPSDATSAQIDTAYDEKCRELKEREPLIMTLSEKEKAVRIQAHLDSAYRCSKEQGTTNAKELGGRPFD